MRPCLLKNYTLDWPAHEKWTDVEYLKKEAGHNQVFVEKSKNKYFAFYNSKYRKEFMSFEEFLDIVHNPKEEDGGKKGFKGDV